MSKQSVSIKNKKHDFISFRQWCETNNPLLLNEWHPWRNRDINMDEVSFQSKEKAWWYLPYDDPETGKHFNFEWQSVINTRTVKSVKCPFLTGNAVWPGFNDLASRYPELAKEWHPDKNNGITAEMVSYKSNRVSYWILPYDDPITGKHFDFEWKASVYDRVMNEYNCPYFSGHDVWTGYNDLKTHFPEIAKEWDYKKNGDLRPEKVLFSSVQKVWWILPYDDPFTGKHFDFTWNTDIRSRTRDKSGCPFLANKAVWTGFNDLATRKPEIAKEWHPTKNGDLQPENILFTSKKKVWWILHYDEPGTGRHFDFEWQATISNRVYRQSGCPVLDGTAVWPGYNDLASNYPAIAAQWHPTMNKKLTPADVTTSSKTKVWWLYSYTDDKGQHFDFIWKASVGSRTRGRNCPYLAGKKVMPAFNDLASNFPAIATQWHPTKNGSLSPTDITPFSQKVVWWFLPYNDPATGKHFDFEWKASVQSRTANGTGCPFLNHAAVWPGFNDLASNYPELAKEWHPTKNKDLTPDKVFYGSDKRVWWFLPYDDPLTGKHFDFEWKDFIKDRTINGYKCPYLSNKRVWKGYNDLASNYPDLALQWHPTKNKTLSPENTYYYSKQKVWWFLSYDDPKTGKHFDFEWRASVEHRTKYGIGCPYLSNMRVWKGYNDLASCFPLLAAEWHPAKNRRITPQSIMCFSKRKVWWLCPECGKEFYMSVRSRAKQGTGCPCGHKTPVEKL